MDEEVRKRYQRIKATESAISPFNPSRVSRFIRKLKLGRAPGPDGVTPEHLKYANNDSLTLLLSKLLNCCVHYGCLPSSFTNGTLIPLLKKPSLDPGLPNNYRPIIVSSVLSKLIEYAILEESSDHAFDPSQYGFVNGRSTQMAICTTQDVITFCNNRGSPVYACGLDVEKAFDGVPHCVLLTKSINIIQDHWWRLLHYWYDNTTAAIKYKGKMSHPFELKTGTRQGGLTSPFLFNLVYQDLIKELSRTTGGIRIGQCTYNVCCYADDLVLTSLTVTGLQNLINCANDYVKKHGISFNAKKSTCAVFGKNYFTSPLHWSINAETVFVSSSIDHLGVLLCDSPKYHVEKQIAQTRKAFYTLQASGLCEHGVKPHLKSYLWRTALQPVLMYGMECIPLHRADKRKMESLQARLIKATLGLSKYMRSTPLLHAMKITKCATLVDIQSVKLLKSIMCNDSRSKNLYIHFICSNVNSCSTLLSRFNEIVSINGISTIRALLNDNDVNCLVREMKAHPVNDGVIDSCRTLLQQYSQEDKEMLKLILTPNNFM